MAKQTKTSGDIESVRSKLEAIGVPSKPGKVTSQRGKYYVVVENKKLEVKPDMIFDGPVPLGSLVGKEVAVVLSKGSIIAIVSFKPGPILCYVPRPDLLKAVRPDLKQALLTKYVNANIIPREFADTFAT